MQLWVQLCCSSAIAVAVELNDKLSLWLSIDVYGIALPRQLSCFSSCLDVMFDPILERKLRLGTATGSFPAGRKVERPQ